MHVWAVLILILLGHQMQQCLCMFQDNHKRCIIKNIQVKNEVIKVNIIQLLYTVLLLNATCNKGQLRLTNTNC